MLSFRPSVSCLWRAPGTSSGLRFVVLARGRRTGADHQQVPARRQAAVSAAGRQDDHVARFHARRAALVAAELHARPAAGDAQNLVHAGVEVQEVVALRGRAGPVAVSITFLICPTSGISCSSYRHARCVRRPQGAPCTKHLRPGRR
jgi:hypothetical protein